MRVKDSGSRAASRGASRSSILDPRGAVRADGDWRVIFHEASHAMVDTVIEEIRKESAAQGKEPRDLWHAVLFYTAGEIAKRALANDGQKDYEPYAYKRGIFRQYWQLVEKHWQPYLDGKSDFAQAIKQVVAGL